MEKKTNVEEALRLLYRANSAHDHQIDYIRLLIQQAIEKLVTRR